jgi:aldehyde:ferredoxin oxidoreductase
MRAVDLISRPPNEFYKALAKGVEYASSKYGGEDFALSFGSNEMPGYHTGPMCYVGYLTGSRHSHLDSAGYSLDQRIMAKGIPQDPKEAAGELFKEESWRQILSSLVVCFFSRGIYDRDVVIKALEVNGVNLNNEDLDRVGKEILRNKFRVKLRMGFKPEEIRIPRRILETETPRGKIDEVSLRKSVKSFFDLLQ